MSPFLFDFLKNVGDAVHSINTVCVGLSSIESGNYTKPPSLTINWSTTDNSFSARKARHFALKASLIFIHDSLSIYLDEIKQLAKDDILVAILSKKNPEFIEGLSEIFSAKYQTTYEYFHSKNKPATDTTPAFEYRKLSSADQIIGLNELIEFEHEYWIPCIVLLIKWRNKIAHRKSQGAMDATDIAILERNHELIQKNHANIDISRTLQDFNNNEITLKDITTLIAITIRFVKRIDENIFTSSHDIAVVESYVRHKNLVPLYNKIANTHGQDDRKRKFKSFIITNLGQTKVDDIEYLYGDFKSITETEPISEE